MIELNELINQARERYNEIKPDVINTKYLSFVMMVDCMDVFLTVTIHGESDEIVSIKTEGGYTMCQNETIKL